MDRIVNRTSLIAAFTVAVLGIVVSNFVGADGSSSGAGSSAASKVTFTIGALAALLFVIGLVAAVVRRRRTSTSSRP
jgi:hypothetical protein